MQLIKNDKQFIEVMTKQVLMPLLTDLSKQIVNKIKININNEYLSTETLKDYTVFEINKHGKGYQSNIFIDDELLQSNESSYSNGYGFNRFASLNGDVDYNNNTIAWHMVSWLEEGVGNLSHASENPMYIGNQPISRVGMFEKTYKQLQSELPDMITKSLKGSGFKVVNK